MQKKMCHTTIPRPPITGDCTPRVRVKGWEIVSVMLGLDQVLVPICVVRFWSVSPLVASMVGSPVSEAGGDVIPIPK